MKKTDDVLQLKIKTKQYSEVIQILQKEIKNIFIQKVKNKNENYKYIDMINLFENVEKYLSNTEIYMFKNFYILYEEENDELYEIDYLIEIYKSIREEV